MVWEGLDLGVEFMKEINPSVDGSVSFDEFQHFIVTKIQAREFASQRQFRRRKSLHGELQVLSGHCGIFRSGQKTVPDKGRMEVSTCLDFHPQVFPCRPYYGHRMAMFA